MNVAGTSARPPAAAPPAPRARTVLFFIAYPQRMAGANRSLFELVTNLPEHVRPLVVCAGPGAAADAYREAGVPCTVLPAPGELGRYGRRFERVRAAAGARALLSLGAYTLRLRRLIRDHDVDLVHANDPRGTLVVAPAARLAGVPLVAHLRGEFSLGSAARAAFERAADRIVTVSEGARKTLSPRGRAKAATVYNGIRDLAAPERRMDWLDEAKGAGRLVVCCFASVVPFKGQHHLVEAAARLRERGWGADRVLFVVVGDLVEGYEFYHDWLAERTAALGVENVRLTGWQRDPFAFYRYADVCVLPSVSRETLQVGARTLKVRGNEGFPRTHLEAMQFGVPIVGTRIAGVPEQVLDGVTGLVVEPSDPAALALALERLLADAALRRRMGDAGRDRVRRLFSTRAYVDGVLGQYDALLGGRRA